MPSDESVHSAHVDAWMQAAKDLPREVLVALFERALNALWQRAQRTLGEVTLAAIVDRVLYTASERYPPLASLKIESAGVRFDELGGPAGALKGKQLFEAVRFVLVEFLTVLGNLTGEILTPGLHSELSKISPVDLTGHAGSNSAAGDRARNDGGNAKS